MWFSRKKKQRPTQPEPQAQTPTQDSERAPCFWSAYQLLLHPPTLLKPRILSSLFTFPSRHPFPRYGHAFVSTVSADGSGNSFLFGGLVGEAFRNDLYLLSLHDMSATLVHTSGRIPTPRVGHASGLFGDMFVVWGGDTGSKANKQDNQLYMLNLVSMEWTCPAVHGPSPGGRYGHGVATIGSKFFVFGGQNSDDFLDDLWAFDVNSRSLQAKATWELIELSTPERPSHRTGYTAITFSDRMIIFGGTNGQHHYNDTWLFEPSIQKWSELQCTGFIPEPREGHAATLVNDVMYVFGGRNIHGKDLNDLTAFNIQEQRWYTTFTYGGALPSGRSGHAMASVGTRIFVLGGEAFKSSKTDDCSLIHVLDTEQIIYPDMSDIS